MDITEFNPYIGTNDDVKKTREIARKCLIEAFNINEKSINIFNEGSNFLIYRPSLQSSIEDYGWYLMSDISADLKNTIMEKIDDDLIISVDIDDMVYLITKTTIYEQNNKSYYATVKITDTVLFTNEKIFMAFELINYVF